MQGSSSATQLTQSSSTSSTATMHTDASASLHPALGGEVQASKIATQNTLPPASDARSGAAVSTSVEYDMPEELRAATEALLDTFHGLDPFISFPSELPGAELKIAARRALFDRQYALAQAAQQFFATYPRQARRAIHTLPHNSGPSETVPLLLQNAAGIVLGGTQGANLGLRFLFDNMEALQAQGVTTLYIDRLLSDQHQALLDNFFFSPAGADMSEALARELDERDSSRWSEAKDKVSYRQMIEKAKLCRIRPVALQNYASYHNTRLASLKVSSRIGYYTTRQKIKIYQAKQTMERYQSLPAAGKWVAWVDSRDTNTYLNVQGLADLTGGIGLRIDDQANPTDWSIRGDEGTVLIDRRRPGTEFKGYVRSDFVLSSRPSRAGYIRQLNTQLRAPDQYTLCQAPDSGYLLLWEGSDTEEPHAAVLQTEQHGQQTNYYLMVEKPAWKWLNERRFTSIDALIAALSGKLKLKRVSVFPMSLDVHATPRQEQTLSLVESHDVESINLLFARERDAYLLQLAQFSSPEERSQFRSGRRNAQLSLGVFPDDVDGQSVDLTAYSSDELKRYCLRVQYRLTAYDKGVLLQAIRSRAAESFIKESQDWQAEIERLGGKNTQLSVQNLYLAMAERRLGLCAGYAAHVAGLALHDASGDASSHYFRKFSAAIENPQERSAQLLGLGLLAWSMMPDAEKFAEPNHTIYPGLAEVGTLLGSATQARAYEISAGRHAIAVGRLLREGRALFFLADANYGYSEFLTVEAFQQALQFHETVFRQLERLGANEGFTVRQYRADIALQPLFKGQHVDARHPQVLRVAELGSPKSLASCFNNAAPLEDDKVFRRAQKRLSRAEYQLTLAKQRHMLPGSPLTALIEQIVDKHTQSITQLPLRNRRFTLRFVGKDALVEWQTGETLCIEGKHYPQDVANLQRYQRFFDDLIADRRTFLSRWFRSDTTRLLETFFLADALPEGGGWRPEVLADLATPSSTRQTQWAEFSEQDDQQLALSVEVQRARSHGTALLKAMRTLWPEAECAHWIPLLNTVVDLGNGEYQIQFLNTDQPERPVQTRRMQKSSFKAFVDYFANHRQQLVGQAPTQQLTGVDGLNSAFAIQALLRFFYGVNRGGEAEAGMKHNLALALQIYDAVNLAQIGQGVGQDLTQVVNVARAVLHGENSAAGMAGSLLTASQRLLTTTGALLQGVALGLDVYKLSQATSEVQRANFATHLAFDSAGLGLTGAGVFGAEALVPLGSVVAGLGVGVTALVAAYEEIAQKAAGVGAYLARLQAAYATATATVSGGYRFDAVHQALLPESPAVLDTIDLRTWRVRYASPKLYRTRHGATGSGAINYFFWAGDAPQLVHDRKQALDLRERLGVAAQAALPSAASAARVLMLPGVPQAYLRYRYNTLPGATLRNDAGFALWRQLEQSRDFDFDYYTFPSEYIIDSLIPEYVRTTIQVFLNDTVRRIEVPSLLAEYWGLLLYHLIGTEGRYVVGLSSSAAVTLQLEGSERTEWVFDARGHGEVKLTFLNGLGVKINDTQVTVLQPQKRLLLLKDGEEVWRLDLENQRQELVEVGASHWEEHKAALKEKVQMSPAELGHQRYIRIHDYPALPGEGELMRQHGIVYYDVQHDHYLYAHGYPDAVLAEVEDNEAYFYNRLESPNKVLRVDTRSGRVLTEYQLAAAMQGLKVWQRDGQILLATGSVLSGAAVYELRGAELVLLSIQADEALKINLAQAGAQLAGSIEVLLQRYLSGVERLDPARPPRGAYLPGEEETVVVDVLSAEIVTERYWLRIGDRRLIKLRYTYSEGIARDLIWLGELLGSTGSSADFFYSAQQRRLYRQERGKVANVLPLTNLTQVTVLGGALYAMRQGGLVEQVDADGVSTLVGVTLGWLKDQGGWQALRTLAGFRTLAVLDIKGIDGQAQAAWMSSGQVVVAVPTLGAQVKFLGVSPEGDKAWLYDPITEMLYEQRPVNEAHLDALWLRWTTPSVTDDPTVFPEARELGHVSALNVLGKTLGLCASDQLLEVPRVAGYEQLLYTVPAGGWVEITASLWSHYHRIVVLGSSATPAERARITLTLDNLLALEVERVGKGWRLTDRSSGRELWLKAAEPGSSQGEEVDVWLRRVGGGVEAVHLSEVYQDWFGDQGAGLRDLLGGETFVAEQTEPRVKRTAGYPAGESIKDASLVSQTHGFSQLVQAIATEVPPGVGNALGHLTAALPNSHRLDTAFYASSTAAG